MAYVSDCRRNNDCGNMLHNFEQVSNARIIVA